ncbi:MAG: nucleotide exchange factor GrpE [Methanotrichaceae archaeon]|nr:nucleotide exchange factor GrpE [Methanotrichaceae archaeon]
MKDEQDVESIVSEAEHAQEIEREIQEDALEELQCQFEETQKLAEERFDQLLRCRADLENLAKRTDKEREECARYAAEKLISKLLTFLDSLEQASKHDEGSKALCKQLSDVLKGEGLVTIEAVGHAFDPYKHEALFQVESDEIDENMVIREIQKGYMLNSKIIRFSKVAVSKRG